MTKDTLSRQRKHRMIDLDTRTQPFNRLLIERVVQRTLLHIL